MAYAYSVVRTPDDIARSIDRNNSILNTIAAGRYFKQSDEEIVDFLVHHFNIIPQYARNYIEEYDIEAADHSLPWETWDKY